MCSCKILFCYEKDAQQSARKLTSYTFVLLIRMLCLYTLSLKFTATHLCNKILEEIHKMGRLVHWATSSEVQRTSPPFVHLFHLSIVPSQMYYSFIKKNILLSKIISFQCTWMLLGHCHKTTDKSRRVLCYQVKLCKIYLRKIEIVAYQFLRKSKT